MTDQAIVSMGNFATTVILARSLSKVEYGTYVVLYGVLLIAHALHASLVTYPISVLGAHRTATELKRFSSTSVLITLLLGVPVSAGVVAAAFVLSKRSDLFPYALAAMFCWQVQETLRRSLMAHLRHRAAIIGDTATYVGQALFVYLLVHHSIDRSARLGFEAIVAGSLLGACVHAIVLGARAPEFHNLIALFREYFRLGRYPLLSILGYSTTSLLFPWVLAYRSFAEVANYQTMMNLIQAVNPVMFSVGNLVVPAVAHEMLKPNGDEKARRVTYRFLLEGLIVLAPLFIGIVVAPRTIMEMLYGRHSGYGEHDIVVRVLVAGALATYIGHVLNSYFMGRKQVGVVAKGQLASSSAGVVCALVLIPVFGVPGAGLSYVAMGMGRSAALFIALRRQLARKRATQAHAIGALQPGEKA